MKCYCIKDKALGIIELVLITQKHTRTTSVDVKR